LASDQISFAPSPFVSPGAASRAKIVERHPLEYKAKIGCTLDKDRILRPIAVEIMRIPEWGLDLGLRISVS